LNKSKKETPAIKHAQAAKADSRRILSLSKAKTNKEQRVITQTIKLGWLISILD